MAPPGSPLETTADLLARVRAGDARARDLLLARIYKPLMRFAHGRLPPSARGMVETQDLVQVALLRTLDHLEEFDSRREGALLAYMCQIVRNLCRDAARGSGGRPAPVELGEDIAATDPTPIDIVVGREARERYDAALEQLSDEQREAVILRVDFRYTYGEIRDLIGAPSSDAVRLTVTRALVRLSKLMQEKKLGSEVSHGRPD